MFNQIRKVFSIETPKPKILYKYISCAKVEYYFPNLTIAFPKLKLLNDPMEASIDEMLKHVVDITELEKQVKYLFDQDLLTDEGYFVRTLSYVELVKKASKNAELKQKYELLTHCKNHVGILSLTTDPLNPLMWSHYSDVYNGICIGFDTEKILSAEFNIDQHFEKCKKLFELLKIQYKQKPPIGLKLSIEDYIVSAFSTKFSNWKYEQEYRVIRPILSSEKNVLVVPIPIDTIKEIYIGQKFLADNLLAIIPRDTKVFLVKNDTNRYGLLKQELYRS